MAKKYCNVDDAKEMTPIIYQDLGFDSEDAYNNFVARIIDRVSREIDRYCSRTTDYFYGGSTITEYFDITEMQSDFHYPQTERAKDFDLSRRTFYVAQTPIISITSIHRNEANIGASDSWIELTFYRADNTTGRIVFNETTTLPSGVMNLRIIYVAGYSAVPTEVRFAAEEWVANIIKSLVQQGLNAKIRFSRPTPLSFSTPEVLTDSIKQKLEPYKLRRM